MNDQENHCFDLLRVTLTYFQCWKIFTISGLQSIILERPVSCFKCTENLGFKHVEFKHILIFFWVLLTKSDVTFVIIIHDIYQHSFCCENTIYYSQDIECNFQETLGAKKSFPSWHLLVQSQE